MVTEVTSAPVIFGPTWRRDKRGRFILPKHTLGWDILGWTAEYLLQPDGPKAGEPWHFTPEQSRFLLWWYGINEQGGFIYRSGMLRRMKGWGKDPLAAAISAVEFVGPCRFDHWEDGKPVGHPHYAAWIQAAAVSRDQTRNLMTIFPAMLSRKAINEYGMDIGKEIIYAGGGRQRIEAVTSSPRALEGGRATFVVKDETHQWIGSNEGHEMSKVIARNVAKSRDGSSRVLAISNAHAPGENSDAQKDYETAQKIAQTGESSDFLYDSLEAPEGIDLDDDASVMAGLLGARGDSEWVSPERLLAEIRDPRTSSAMARRFYLNQIVAEEDKPFDYEQWLTLAKPGHVVPDGALITLGFDGSTKRDHTALIGTEIGTGHQWVVGYWEPRETEGGDTEINFLEVDETITLAFKRWKVWRLNADPYYWRDMVGWWAGRYGAEVVVSWSTTIYRKMAGSLLAYRNAIQTGALTHDGDARFAACIQNAHKQMREFTDDDGNRMWTIQKERPDSPLKIDAAMAGCLSWEAYTAAIAAGVSTEPTKVGMMLV